MRKRFNTSKAVIRVIAIAAAGSLCGVVSAQITGVAEGSDSLQTAPGTQVTITLPTGPVTSPLTGKPIPGRGNTETIVRRKKQTSFTTAEAGVAPAVTIPIQIEALNLQGTLGSCTVTITLAPTPASTGTMMINVTGATGGAFYSKLTVNYIAMLTPAATSPLKMTGKYTMPKGGGTWTSVHGSNDYLMVRAYPNPVANEHTGLPARESLTSISSGRRRPEQSKMLSVRQRRWRAYPVPKASFGRFGRSFQG